ncbi:hypothetical protein D3C87_1990110 [compost metagenome]
MVFNAGMNFHFLVIYSLPISEVTSQFKNVLASSLEAESLFTTRLAGIPTVSLSFFSALSLIGIGNMPMFMLGVMLSTSV